MFSSQNSQKRFSRTTVGVPAIIAQFMLVAFALLACMSVSTQAQTLPGPPNPVMTTYVSSNGSDRNSCDSPGNACRTLANALQQTLKGGEILVLDSGIYDQVRLDKAVSIIAAPGATAIIKRDDPASPYGITVNVSATSCIVLRGLTIASSIADAGSCGILAIQGGEMHLENCVISGFMTGMVVLNVNNVFVKDSVFRDNSAIGLDFQRGPNTNASVDHCRFEKNQTGIMGRGDDTSTPILHLSFSNSEIASNTYGILLSGGESGRVEANIANCVVTNNTYGIRVQLNGVAYLSSTAVVNNVNGLWAEGNGKLYSQGNNMVYGNLQDSFGMVQVVGGR